jgi:hypothetical protein
VIVKPSFRRDREMPFDNLSSTFPRSKASCHSMSRQEFYLVNTAYHQRLVEAEEDVRVLSNGRTDCHLRRPSRNGCHHPPQYFKQVNAGLRTAAPIGRFDLSSYRCSRSVRLCTVQTRFWSNLHMTCMFDNSSGYPLH